MIEMATGEYPYSECSTPAQIYKKVTSGQPPQCFQKIDNLELREIIGRCIRQKKEERPTVKELLQMEFFQEDTGFKVELVEKEKIVNNLDPKIELRLIVTDAKKRKDRYKENEAVQFAFTIDKDNPDEVATALVKNGYLIDEDIRTVASLIRNQITFIKKEREKLQPMQVAPQQQPAPVAQQSTQNEQQQPQPTPTSAPPPTQQAPTTQIHPQQTPQPAHIIHPQQTPQSAQQTPSTLTQSIADQQLIGQTPSTLSQKLDHPQPETPQLHGTDQLTNNMETPKIADDKIRMVPLVMPLANNLIQRQQLDQQSQLEAAADHNQQPITGGTVPSSPDCLSPGSPKTNTTLNAATLNHLVNQNLQTSSIPDFPSTVNSTAINTVCALPNAITPSPSVVSSQAASITNVADASNPVLNHAQNQANAVVLQSYSCPETPTALNQQPNFSTAKVADQQMISTTISNLEQLSSATNSANSTIGTLPLSSTQSTNSILPPQVPNTSAPAPAAYPSKPMPSNLENLKQEKKLTASTSSNDLKVNIEQGLQAIFASSCASTNPVASLANTANNPVNNAVNNGQSTPGINSASNCATQPALTGGNNLPHGHVVNSNCTTNLQQCIESNQSISNQNHAALPPICNQQQQVENMPDLNGQATALHQPTPSFSDKELDNFNHHPQLANNPSQQQQQPPHQQQSHQQQSHQQQSHPQQSHPQQSIQPQPQPPVQANTQVVSNQPISNQIYTNQIAPSNDAKSMNGNSIEHSNPPNAQSALSNQPLKNSQINQLSGQFLNQPVSQLTGNQLSQPPAGDRLKRRRFTIIPVRDDPITSPDASITANHNNTVNSLMTNHCLNNAANLNAVNLNAVNLNNAVNNHNADHHQHTASSSCSNSNTMSSTSSLTKTSSSEEEPSSSLSGYSTPADSISQIKGRFLVTTIDESTAGSDSKLSLDKKQSTVGSRLSSLYINQDNVVHLLSEAHRSQDKLLKERTIRFLCLNYPKVSQQAEFKKLDKAVLFEIMDELASLYRMNLIKNQKLTNLNNSDSIDSNNLSI